ncbi:hypothetical protein BC628DRAFT_1096225 [Trametes gibbosa]|nr:hypothetical protein BC628DRAFT_1096225 [Trametes gibbosa]
MADDQPDNQDNAQGGVIVPRGGWWMGSSSSMFQEQLAADIYLQDIWQTAGYVQRVATICVSWGMSVAVMEEAHAPVAGSPGPWHIANYRLQQIIVRDFGQQHLLVPGAPLVLPGAQPPGLGIFLINGQHTMAHRLPWHHRLILEVSDPNGEPIALHYHKHKPRKGHDMMVAPKLMDQNDPKRKHWIFKQV